MELAATKNVKNLPTAALTNPSPEQHHNSSTWVTLLSQPLLHKTFGPLTEVD